MKIRHGFVSNSSSSSFIVHVPKSKEPCPTCGHVEENILKYFNGEDSSVDARGKEAVLKYISDWGFRDKELKKIEDLIDKYGGNVAIVSCSNCDETAQAIAEEHLVYNLN